MFANVCHQKIKTNECAMQKQSEKLKKIYGKNPSL